MKKIVLITEILKPPYDEGIKKSVYYIYSLLRNIANTKVLCRKGFSDKDIYIINTNKFFLSAKLKKFLNEFKPHLIFYIPFSSNTFASHLRIFFLKKLYPKSKTVFLILQPKKYKNWQKMFLKIFKPDILLTTSIKLSTFLKNYNIKTKLILPFTDLSKFKPTTEEQKKKLRKKYNIPMDKFVISHIGHINWGRNLQSLIPLQQDNNQVLIIGSSSTPDDAPKEEKLKKQLQNSGIIILDGYIKNIQEIYQLSDLYIFPVIFQGGSINFPLSILEARACEIPVLTTDFGSVKTHFGNDNGGIIYTNPNEFLERIETIKKNNNTKIKSNITNLNEKFINILKDTINNL